MKVVEWVHYCRHGRISLFLEVVIHMAVHDQARNMVHM